MKEQHHTHEPTGDPNITYQEEDYPETEILDNLHPFVREWFTTTFGHFSPPQRYSIRNIQLGINSLICSPTGSGKTLSAFLAIINELVLRADTGTLDDKVYCIYISPLKALANDINRNLKEPLDAITIIAERYGRRLPIRIGTRTGDTTTNERAKQLDKPPHILITTPESLAIALSSIKFSQALSTVRYLIIDEIHALAENKRGTHLAISMERLARRATFTRIGLSATVAPLPEIARFLVGYEDPREKRSRPCRIVDIQAHKRLDLKVLSPVPDMMRASHTQLQDAMYNLLHDLIQSHRTTLVFTNTRSGTERVVHQLRDRYPSSYANVLDADEEREALDEAEGHFDERLEEEAELIKQPSDNIALNTSKDDAAKHDSTTSVETNIANDHTTDNAPDGTTTQNAQHAGQKQKNLIGAHHGSLSKEHRLRIENMLKAGELRSVVCSTSLELGIDIGYIDLVVLLGSPKSVARALQRIGRSGHKLHEEAKGRIIVLDRDDLVECSVLLKAAIERKIDTVSMPSCALDVLAQHIYGMAIEAQTGIEDAWETMTRAYPYGRLTRKDFDAVIDYLAGAYPQLEERNIYGKIWLDREQGTFGKKGRLARLIYMTNVGTIPDEASVQIKVGEHTIGTVTEDFAERLKPGDVFVLGGEAYQFKFSRGMTAQVTTSAGRMPTVPNWVSEMLPLSFDLANAVQELRRHMDGWLSMGRPPDEVKAWLRGYLYVDEYGIDAIYAYFAQQHSYSRIPHSRRLVLEHFKDGSKKYVFIHSLYGRRVNDVLARSLAYINGKLTGRDVEIGITDNGFYLKSTQPIQALRALQLLREEEIYRLMEIAIDTSEVLKRRFRHCAARALMILRQYKGHQKSVGRQQISSQLIISAVRRIGNDFPILKEARREILEDHMDIAHATEIVRRLQSGDIRIEERTTDIPSPFAFNMVLQGYIDLLKVEDRVAFVRRMHEMVLESIEEASDARTEKRDGTDGYEDNTDGKHDGEKDGRTRNNKKEGGRHGPLLPAAEFSYDKLWDAQHEAERKKKEDHTAYLDDLLREASRKIGLDADITYHARRLIAGETTGYPEKFKDWLRTLLRGTVPKVWKDDLIKYFAQQEKLL